MHSVRIIHDIWDISFGVFLNFLKFLGQCSNFYRSMVRPKIAASKSNPTKRTNVASTSTTRVIRTKKKARRQLPIDEPTSSKGECDGPTSP